MNGGTVRLTLEAVDTKLGTPLSNILLDDGTALRLLSLERKGGPAQPG